MSINKEFELYKIKREIERSGTQITFYRPVLNEFGEPVYEDKSDNPVSEVVCVVDGLYHEQSQYVNVFVQDDIQSRTRKTPMFLAPFEEVKDIRPGDFAKLSSGPSHVTGVRDIQGWGIIGDVSFEYIDTGANF